MYTSRDFSMSDPGENEVYTFDFVRDVETGETISSATWTCAVADDSHGEDEDAATRVSLTATNAGTRTSQRITGLVGGVKYVLRAVVVTSAGNTKSLWSHVTCEAPH